jgi:AcrR family transcriptional regulator
MPVVARVQRTQQQRRDETRRLLLDAAIESLIEVGYARTTTLEVQRRANASRGALLHHFPSKIELLVAAVDHLAEMRARELKVLATELPRTARADAVLELLWQCFSGEFFQVAMELRAAARTDPELRAALVPAERALRDRIVAQARSLLGAEAAARPRGELDRAIDLTLHFFIGAAMTAALHKDDRRVRALVDDWKRLFGQMVAVPRQPSKRT